MKEHREGVEGVAYTVELAKTYHRWRNWPRWQLGLLAACLCGLAASVVFSAARFMRVLD